MIGSTVRLSTLHDALQTSGDLQPNISHADEQASRVAALSLKQFCLSEMPLDIKAHIWSYIEPREIATTSPFICRSLRIPPEDRSHIVGLQIEGRGGKVTANALVDYQQLVRDGGTHEAWIHALGKVTEFDLDRKYITSQISVLSKSLLPHCKNIKKISSSIYNSINNQELLIIIRSFSQLQSLNLKGCHHITDIGLQAALPFLTKLQNLNLNWCSITDAGLQAALPSLKELRSLDLSWCYGITDVGFQALSSLTELRSLEINWNHNITDAGLQAALPFLTKLQNLNLSECRNITDIGLQTLSSLTELQSLNLRLCPHITDAGLQAALPFLTKLQNLNLGGDHHITDVGLQALSSLTELQSLKLSFCDITDAGLQTTLPFLTKLKSLNLSECHHITDVGLQEALASLTELQNLNLSWCGITDARLQAMLSSLTQLQSLDLRGCDITDAGLQALSSLTKLQSLDLRACLNVSAEFQQQSLSLVQARKKRNHA